jgi:hypothetical protein
MALVAILQLTALFDPTSCLLYTRLHCLGWRGAWVLWQHISGLDLEGSVRRRDGNIYDPATLLHRNTSVREWCIAFR